MNAVIDVFRMLAILFLAITPLILLARPPRTKKEDAQAAAH
jgi:hypothetical protein